jgi:hypothetical protein
MRLDSGFWHADVHEISLLRRYHRFAFEAVQRLFCDLRNHEDDTFGGVLVVLAIGSDKLMNWIVDPVQRRRRPLALQGRQCRCSTLMLINNCFFLWTILISICIFPVTNLSPSRARWFSRSGRPSSMDRVRISALALRSIQISLPSPYNIPMFPDLLIRPWGHDFAHQFPPLYGLIWETRVTY